MPFFGVPIRNGVPIGLGSVAGFGISPFDPSQLFSAGEQGAWYDPSDLSTMFNDAAGTQPITSFTTNQPVGLLLDKSGRGNNATASGSARPVLSKRYNLLTRTEEFDNAAWGRTGIAAFGSGSVANTTATTDPLGGNTADFLLPFTALNRQRVNQGVTVQTSTQMRMTCYIKPGNYSKVALRESNTSGYYVSFDLSSTTSPTILASRDATGTVSHVGNGWFLCSMTTTIVGTNFGASVYVLSPTYTTGDPETPVWSPDQVSGIYVWGADLRRTIDANAFQPAYQRVVTATNYDGDGFLPYLEYSGAQAMATGTITPGAIDTAQVFAGATKLSATTGLVYEFSNNGSINNGAFNSFVDGGGNGTNTIDASLRGTQQTFFANSTFAPPINYVQCVAFDIAGASRNLEIIPRINGVVNQTGGGGAADAGSGNFGNYPLYFGARNSASLFFTGRMYSNIVRFGATLSAAQISATESWVAQRTGVSL